MTEYLLIQNVQDSNSSNFLTTRIARILAKNKKSAIRLFIKEYKDTVVTTSGNIFCLEISEIPLIV